MKRALICLCVLLVCARTVFGQEGAVARILGAPGAATMMAEVELQVVKGAFYAGDPVDVLAKSEKVEATLQLPANVDMLMAGDRVKVGIKTKRPVTLSGALVAAAGAYATYAAAEKVSDGGPAKVAAAPAPAPQAGTAPDTSACPFTPAELRAALGLDVKDGRAGPSRPFSGGTSMSCQYEPTAFGAPALIVNQIAMTNPADANPDTYLRQLAGAMQPVPGDPDRAHWQGNQGDLTNATLHYARRGVIVEARVTIGPRDPNFQAMRDKLVKLRRLP